MTRRINNKTGRRDLEIARSKKDSKLDRDWYKQQGWKNVRTRRTTYDGSEAFITSGTTKSIRKRRK